MKSLTYVEFDIDYCALSFGVPPCHASLTEPVVDGGVYRQLFDNTNDSWSPANSTLTANAGGYSTWLLNSTSAATITKTVSYAPALSRRYVMVDIECITANNATLLDLLYSTAGHSYSSSYHKQLAFAMTAGQRRTFVFDMHALTAGTTDWEAQTITGLRFAFDNSTAAGQFRIHEVRVGGSAFDPINKKCFNTLKTCQSRLDFVNEPVTLRFAKDVDYLPRDIEAIPALLDVAFTSATISMGENLGQRATVVATFREQPHSDTGPGFDKYRSDRPYENAFRQGSFWSKFRARIPYLQGRPFRLIRGLEGQTLGEMDTRYYVIESFNGPDAKGVYTITAKDVLKLADNDRAQCPKLNNGFLVAGIANNASSLTLSPTGVGNAEYPASGYAAIGGKEIVSFTRSGDVLTITRAQFGTVAVAHSNQDRVQLCKYYNAQTPSEIINDLLVNFAGIDQALCPVDAWGTEVETYLSRVYTTVIAEPTGVNKLISELIEQAALAMWWDDQAQQIRLQVLRPNPGATIVNPDNYVEQSYAVAEQPNKRLSQVWFYFGMINYLNRVDDANNYRSCNLSIAAQEESDFGSAAIKKIYSRWIAAFGRSIAERAGSLILSRYKQAPRKFSFNMWRYGPEAISLGGAVNLQSTLLQDDEGFGVTVPAQITRFEPGPALFNAEAEEVLGEIELEDLNNRTIIVDTNSYNLNMRTLHDALFPALDGDVSAINVTCIIETGVIVGSLTGGVSFDVGSWPGTIGSVTLKVKGRIQGRGGRGAYGYSIPTAGTVSENAQPGSTALYTRFPIDLEINQIWAGSGGGGSRVVSSRGSGGGGGAGFPAGAGGYGLSSSGSSGSDTSGGVGGSVLVDGSTTKRIHGGDGGDPGLAGDAAYYSGSGSNPTSNVYTRAPAAAGYGIDGISYCNITVAGDVRGSQVN